MSTIPMQTSNWDLYSRIFGPSSGRTLAEIRDELFASDRVVVVPGPRAAKGGENLPVRRRFDRAANDSGAACSTHEYPQWWWEPTSQRDFAHAVEVCRGCPVAAECLGAALDSGEEWGVWGGVWFVDGEPRTRFVKAPVMSGEHDRLEGADRSVA